MAIALFSVVLAGIGPVGSAVADTPWQKAHPRREEVNGRLAHQNHRIHQEVREGELTRRQAGRLHREDHRIRQEERDMAGQNGSHITRLEHRTLNQQENAVSRQIGR
ncbi:MAG: hypothetical protein J2P48_03230 [Alphaproteobacteria bacterium]|nr:hypothetical protein [Alphaproteobacteria bacterium]